LVLQDQPHLIAIDLIASALAAETSKGVPSGTDPIARFEFGILVCVFVYFFKTKKNRDALFKFINDMHWARSPDHAPPPAISKGCKVLINPWPGIEAGTERVQGQSGGLLQRGKAAVACQGYAEYWRLRGDSYYCCTTAATAATAVTSATTASGSGANDRIPI
jgi:hypothetical protein